MTDEGRSAFHARLTEELAARGWRPAELARRLGIDRSNVFHWLTHRNAPTEPHALAVAELVGWARGDVLAWFDPRSAVDRARLTTREQRPMTLTKIQRILMAMIPELDDDIGQEVLAVITARFRPQPGAHDGTDTGTGGHQH